MVRAWAAAYCVLFLIRAVTVRKLGSRRYLRYPPRGTAGILGMMDAARAPRVCCHVRTVVL
ncbi:hypothetical protein BDW72DRAFT_181494 [Aspergillus terricola var. indicus]